MFPTSLPGAIRGGITAARPTVPRAARRDNTGMAAASSGVRPPNWSSGSSAHPSGTQMTYFTPCIFAPQTVAPAADDRWCPRSHAGKTPLGPGEALPGGHRRPGVAAEAGPRVVAFQEDGDVADAVAVARQRRVVELVPGDRDGDRRPGLGPQRPGGHRGLAVGVTEEVDEDPVAPVRLAE